MKRVLVALAVAAVGAVILLHPVPRPAPPATGWSSGSAGSPGDAGFSPDRRSFAVRAGSAEATPTTARRARSGRTGLPGQALVYVAGDVAKPGVYPVGSEARVADALALAGGARPNADLVAVNLAAHLADGDEVVVPVKGEAEFTTGRRRHSASSTGGVRGATGTKRSKGPRRSRRHKRSRSGAARPSDDVAPTTQVDINTADAATLATVPGIGAGLAERIVAFRSANGPFATVDELLDVSGITDRRLEALIPYVVAR
jgi:competence protein ComEA